MTYEDNVNLSFKVLNIKLISVRETSAEVYSELIERMFAKGRMVNLGKYVGIMDSFAKREQVDDVFYFGNVVKAKKAEESYKKDEDDVLVPVVTEEQHYNDPQWAKFIFVPKAHRFAFIETEKVDINWFKKFVRKSFDGLLSDNEKIELSVKTSETFVTDFLQGQSLRKVKIRMSVSNSDSFNSPLMQAIEANMKATHTQQYDITAISDKKDSINLMENDILNPLAGIALDNGEISAWDQENHTPKPTVTTKESPQVYEIQTTNSNFIKDIYLKILSIFRPEESSDVGNDLIEE
ncbi:DUF4747 family protein [Carboxylicivirga sediminis]|uniref:DUF4747 family protein n=1 Tax=Carboxylicivirga sediminis TaxID=2006564 RepID=A0A941EZM3_9BACT|nr:DUF4747 family protein [Carboxylicivirga sediminis]MBR8534441.1 DUF4747 family protein [Carboxylicivirga sediminis]